MELLFNFNYSKVMTNESSIVMTTQLAIETLGMSTIIGFDKLASNHCCTERTSEDLF